MWEETLVLKIPALGGSCASQQPLLPTLPLTFCGLHLCLVPGSQTPVSAQGSPADSALSGKMGKGYKVVVCGMASVGKTAILEQLLYGKHTIGEIFLLFLLPFPASCSAWFPKTQ